MAEEMEQARQSKEQDVYKATGKKSRMVPRVNVRSLHRADCERRSKGGGYTRCQCPKQLWWSDHGTLIRKSAETGDESEALRQADQMTQEFRAAAEGKPVPEKIVRHTVEEAITRFLKNKKKKGEVATEKHIGRLERELGRFLRFTNSKNLLYITDVNTDHMEEYSISLEGKQNTRSKMIGRIIGFFKFCVEIGWITRNIADADAVKIASDDAQEPKALTDAQFEQVLAAIPKVNGKTANEQRTKLRCLLLLMRWTGLAIRDAVTIERSRFEPNGHGLYKLFLRRAKTGKPVYCTLAADVTAEILSSPQTGRYLFVDDVPKGERDLDMLVNNWVRLFTRLNEAADLKDENGESLNFTSHMLRHTFVKWCLNNDITLQDTAMLIGDTVVVVAKHYSGWVPERQDRLTERMTTALKQTEEKKTLQSVFGT